MSFFFFTPCFPADLKAASANMTCAVRNDDYTITLLVICEIPGSSRLASLKRTAHFGACVIFFTFTWLKLKLCWTFQVFGRGLQGGTVTWLGVLSRCHTLSGARIFSKKVEEVKKMGFFIGRKAW